MLDRYNVSGYLEYINGLLHINDIPYTKLVSEKSSPTICTSLDRVRSNIATFERNLERENAKIFYAIKACYDKKVVTAVHDMGVGVEVISEHEWLLAIKAGFSPNNIIFNGLGRSGDELMKTLTAGAIVNIDSLSELAKLKPYRDIFSTVDAKIGLRINPQFDGEGNFIKRHGKLGMNYKEAVECITFSKELGLRVVGFSFHIFSNLTDYLVYKEPIKSLLKFIKKIESEFSLVCNYIDIGGGIAPRMFFENDTVLGEFVIRITSLFKESNVEDLRILLEPGRYIVADATVILSQIKTIKRNSGGTWAVLDIGTNYLIPAPGSNYKVVPCTKDNKITITQERVSFVDGICSPAGYICEDYLNVEEGQYIAILNSGAYTSVMREEFVYGTPRSVYMENGQIVCTIEKISLERFAAYHGWK